MQEVAGAVTITRARNLAGSDSLQMASKTPPASAKLDTSHQPPRLVQVN